MQPITDTAEVAPPRQLYPRRSSGNPFLLRDNGLELRLASSRSERIEARRLRFEVFNLELQLGLTSSLAIGLDLKRLLEGQGITVVMTRTTDAALAGDDFPDLGCHGAAFRDVNGDGQAGFDPEGKTRTRDELQSRLDLVNLARADLLVSIHVNSITQNGVAFPIAATETYYTDETVWGVSATQRLAQLVQHGVIVAVDPIAAYDRQDRGISATNLYIVAPPLFVTTPARPDPLKQPTRGALMPAILTEVGSITLPAEQDLLLLPAGQAAVAQGIADALGSYFGARPLAVRYDAMIPLGAAGTVTDAVGGSGPPYWPTGLRRAEWALGLPVRLTNTGTAPWPPGLRLLGGWVASRAWADDGIRLTDLGSPPLQLTTGGP